MCLRPESDEILDSDAVFLGVEGLLSVERDDDRGQLFWSEYVLFVLEGLLSILNK